MKRLAFDWMVSSFTVLKAKIIDIRYKMTPITAARTTNNIIRTMEADKTIPGTCKGKK